MAALRLFLCLGLAVLAASAQQPYLPLSVDAGSSRGRVRFHTEAVLHPRPGLGRDYAAYAEAFGERTPDRLVVPVSLAGAAAEPADERGWVVFPDRDADPEDPASYDFGPLDAIVAEAAAQGPAVVFQLEVAGPATADLNAGEAARRLSEAARRVAMHFNRGWADGHHLSIREWRVCDVDPSQTQTNESGGSGLMSPAAAAVLDALRGLDPGLRVGSCLSWPGGASAADQAVPKAPAGRSPHFYSWNFPETLRDAHGPALTAQRIRKQLDGSGLATAELTVSSPAVRVDPPGNEPAGRASRLAAALIHLQDTPVVSVALDLWSPAAGGGAKRQAVLRTAAQLSKTPLRLGASGGGAESYAVLAGRSEDRTAVQILVANEQPGVPDGTAPPGAAGGSTQHPPGPAAEGYQLEVADLPWGAADFAVYAYRIDDQNDLALVWEGGGRGGSFHLRRKLPPGAVDLLLLQQQERPVYDRLPRRRSRR